MQRKQKVIRRKYLDLKSSDTSAFESSATGGFNSISKSSGSSRLFMIAAALRIFFTSVVLPLISNHLGDSGITNLLLRMLLLLNYEEMWAIHTITDIKKHPVVQYTVGDFDSLVLDMQFQIS